MRHRLQPEKPQQELRFTARDPVLYGSLALLEKDGERHSKYLPKDLYLFAVKRMSIDFSDNYDGNSLNYSTFMQYRQAVEGVSMRGKKKFRLDPVVNPLYAGGPDGRLVGVGMRVRLDPLHVDTILAPPLYGPNNYRAPLNEQQKAQVDNGREILKTARELQYIPVRYEIGSVVDEPDEALERLRNVVEMGAWVSQLTVVPSYPRSARLADIRREEGLPR